MLYIEPCSSVLNCGRQAHAVALGTACQRSIDETGQLLSKARHQNSFNRQTACDFYLWLTTSLEKSGILVVLTCRATVLHRYRFALHVLDQIGPESCNCSICVQVALATGEFLACNLPKQLQQQLLFRGSGFFIVAPVLGDAEPQRPDGSTYNHESSVKAAAYDVVYILDDDDPPMLAQQGLW